MNKRIWAAATFVLAAFAMAVPRVEAERRAEVIYEWNQLLQQSTAGPPFSQARTYAITHIAMADAVVAIDGQYAPFHAQVSGRNASPYAAIAAAAQAAHDVLAALNPAGLATFDTALNNRLATLPAGPAKHGVAVGKELPRRSSPGVKTMGLPPRIRSHRRSWRPRCRNLAVNLQRPGAVLRSWAMWRRSACSRPRSSCLA